MHKKQYRIIISQNYIHKTATRELRCHVFTCCRASCNFISESATLQQMGEAVAFVPTSESSKVFTQTKVQQGSGNACVSINTHNSLNSVSKPHMQLAGKFCNTFTAWRSKVIRKSIRQKKIPKWKPQYGASQKVKVEDCFSTYIPS